MMKKDYKDLNEREEERISEMAFANIRRERFIKMFKVLLHYITLVILLVFSINSFVSGYQYKDLFVAITSLYVVMTSSYFLMKMFEEDKE